MSSATALTFAPGDMIADRYRIERVLGRGGMGVVVAATHVDLLERRALKLMLPEFAVLPGAVERFLREARAAVRLKSAHIARVHDVGRLPDGVPFIVMEYLDGIDLSRLLKREGPLEATRAVGYVLEACEAIAEAHGAGIIHRDLKPANLFLARDGDGRETVKVLDFGISKLVASESAEPQPELTHTTSMVGSPFYMSPEQIKSAKNVGPRSDVWSLGVILFQLVTRKLPFRGEDRFSLCVNVVQEPAPAPSSIVPTVPPEVDRIVLRCLAKEPEERYQSVLELARDLRPLVEGGAGDWIERAARGSMAGASSSTSTPGLENAGGGRAASVPPDDRPSATNEIAPTGASTAATWGSAAVPSITPRRRGYWKFVAIAVALGLGVFAAASWMRAGATARSNQTAVAADPASSRTASTAAGVGESVGAPAPVVATAPAIEPSVVADAPVATTSAALAPPRGIARPAAATHKTPASASAAAAPPVPPPPPDNPFGKDRK